MSLFEVTQKAVVRGIFDSYTSVNTFELEADSENEVLDYLASFCSCNAEYTVAKVTREPVLTITGKDLREKAQELRKKREVEKRKALYQSLKSEFEPSEVPASV